MDKYTIVLVVVLLCIALIMYTQMDGSSSKNKSFKQIVQSAFPKFSVIERNRTIMICEINHRNEPDELVFIRIDPNQKKNIRFSGRMLIATYPKQPSVSEMKKDFTHHLKF
ncbi:hypothetical protein [Acinetobacter portensis]|uniref:hypothetical protein n=1 Tax=Acinetobacter portensis TaxID=1839785 RepID=UPI0013D8D8F4|nr:hypothetical protein [Acinetobacter portensis]